MYTNGLLFGLMAAATLFDTTAATTKKPCKPRTSGLASLDLASTTPIATPDSRSLDTSSSTPLVSSSTTPVASSSSPTSLDPTSTPSTTPAISEETTPSSSSTPESDAISPIATSGTSSSDEPTSTPGSYANIGPSSTSDLASGNTPIVSSTAAETSTVIPSSSASSSLVASTTSSLPPVVSTFSVSLRSALRPDVNNHPIMYLPSNGGIAMYIIPPGDGSGWLPATFTLEQGTNRLMILGTNYYVTTSSTNSAVYSTNPVLASAIYVVCQPARTGMALSCTSSDGKKSTFVTSKAINSNTQFSFTGTVSTSQAVLELFVS